MVEFTVKVVVGLILLGPRLNFIFLLEIVNLSLNIERREAKRSMILSKPGIVSRISRMTSLKKFANALNLISAEMPMPNGRSSRLPALA